VKIEKWIMGFVVSLLDVFCSCVVLLMLVLIVLEKTRDCGVLLALGATPRGVFSIFLLTGLTITAVGTACGLVAGWLFLGAINSVHDGIYSLTGLRLWDPEVYLLDRIPTSVNPGIVVMSILPALLFGFGASLVPAIWAARKDPIQAIHHE
jgi:lipoprotein-releasing system permease protein